MTAQEKDYKAELNEFVHQRVGVVYSVKKCQSSVLGNRTVNLPNKF